MAKKKKFGGGHGGGHGWFVTFADLMGLLMSFFVMLTAYSTQDKEKLNIVAGSMRDAFGTVKEYRYAGIVEVDGIPTRPNLKHAQIVDPSEATDHTAPRLSDIVSDGKISTLYNRRFALAAATLRQALQDMPDIAEASKNLMVEETKDGLNIQLVDQEGRSMFPEGSKVPFDRTRKVLEVIAPIIKAMPNRISITGYTSAQRGGSYSGVNAWELSSARASNVRNILAEQGIRDDRFFSVVGKADTEPLFPEDPYVASNRRVSILLIHEAPPLPSKGL